MLRTNTYLTRGNDVLFDAPSMLVVRHDLAYRNAERNIPYAYAAMALCQVCNANTIDKQCANRTP